MRLRPGRRKRKARALEVQRELVARDDRWRTAADAFLRARIAAGQPALDPEVWVWG